MTAAWLWVASLVAPSLVTALSCALPLSLERVRTLAVVCASASLAIAGVVLFAVDPEALRIPWRWHGSALLGPSVLSLTDLSQPLVVLPPALWLVTVSVTPRARLGRAGLGRTAIATAFGTLAFLTESPAVLACCWTVSGALFVVGLSSGKREGASAIVHYQVASVLLLVAGVALTSMTDEDTRSAGVWLTIVAVLIRKGIFPFHAWIPEALDRGRIGPTVLFSAPQLGTFVAATLVLPHATPVMLRVVAVLSLVTALYGAALALFQADARRALGYLFVSQSALVLAGLDCTSVDALTGALILWLSSALAFTGLARTVLALEARRGRLELTRYHGGFDQMPLLATSFLVFGLAITGFPGTLGFIGQEMLINGAVSSFPTLGFLTIGASALTGLAVLRMYFALFCGRPAGAPRLPLRRREAVVFGAVAAYLVGAGLIPTGIIGSRERASAQLFRQHDDEGRR